MSNTIHCIVVCDGRNGPLMFPCEVSAEGYDDGEHYERAKSLALETDWIESVYVVFDENDGPQWLFDAVPDEEWKC